MKGSFDRIELDADEQPKQMLTQDRFPPTSGSKFGRCGVDVAVLNFLTGISSDTFAVMVSSETVDCWRKVESFEQCPVLRIIFLSILGEGPVSMVFQQ